MRADDQAGPDDERPLAEHLADGVFAERLQRAVVGEVRREGVDRVVAELGDGAVLVHRRAEVGVHRDARHEAVEAADQERLRRGAHDVRDVAARVDDCVPAPAGERCQVARPVALDPLHLGVELRIRPPAVEERELVAARRAPSRPLRARGTSARRGGAASRQVCECGEQAVDLVLGVVVDDASSHGAVLEPELAHRLDRVVVAVPDREVELGERGRDLLG